MKKQYASTLRYISISIFMCLALLAGYFISMNNKTFSVKYLVDIKEYYVINNISKGELIENIAPPIKDGHEFLGWYNQNTKFDFSTPVFEDITLVAMWEVIPVKTYNVSFDTTCEYIIDAQIIEENSVVSKPNDPQKDGYIFDGWYLNDVKYNFDIPVISDLNLIAKWQATHIVSFNSNGADQIPNQIIENGHKVLMPSIPSKSGFKFLGWYYLDNVFDFNAVITENIVLDAKWEEIIDETTM